MSYRNDRLNRSMRSLDAMTNGFQDISKVKVLSDGGVGVERIMEAVEENARTARDSRAERCARGSRALREDEREEKLFEAEMRLVEAGKGYLIRVLLLIVENKSNRKESLRSVANRTYFRHRDALLRFFSQPQPSTSTSRSGTQVHMEI